MRVLSLTGSVLALVLFFQRKNCIQLAEATFPFSLFFLQCISLIFLFPLSLFCFVSSPKYTSLIHFYCVHYAFPSVFSLPYNSSPSVCKSLLKNFWYHYFVLVLPLFRQRIHDLLRAITTGFTSLFFFFFLVSIFSNSIRHNCVYNRMKGSNCKHKHCSSWFNFFIYTCLFNNFPQAYSVTYFLLHWMFIYPTWYFITVCSF